MSTLAYASLTTKREEATPGTSTKEQGPGMSTYIDAFAGLVPAEVLTLHALIIAQTITPPDKGKGAILLPENVKILQWAFYGLLALSMIIYIAGRGRKKDAKSNWDKWDCLRMLIPPLAFTGWTMIQRATAFDAVIFNSNLSDTVRNIAALFLAVLLGLAASALAYKADEKTKPQKNDSSL